MPLWPWGAQLLEDLSCDLDEDEVHRRWDLLRWPRTIADENERTSTKVRHRHRCTVLYRRHYEIL